MRVMLIVNSAASSVTARTRVVIQKALAADHDVTLAETSRRGHASRLAQSAARAGTDVVVVLGGDGTLNEAANGLAGTDTALAPIPGGSTNVFARTLGLSDDPVEATAAILDALNTNAVKPVGLGSVNGRYFLFHTGLGFDAALVAEVEKRGGLKRYAGHPLFAWAGLRTYFGGYDHRSPAFAIHYPDGTEVASPFAIVMNTDPYTFLGSRPFTVAPAAALDRPLAVLALTSMGPISFVRLAGKALTSTKGVGTTSSTDERLDVTECTVVGNRPFPYQVDGDYLGEVTELEIAHHPGILRLVIPSRAPRPA
ncbi:MAG: diacylglycerol kinase family lipid kinase [Acidimicrobiales bacterium]|nr:diacylglycerol kinase family lipid kinase [Acidimicrobiales bacterium]